MKKISLAIVVILSLCFTSCELTNTKKTDTNVTTVQDYKITNANDALSTLKEGNKRFINDKSRLINVTSERRNQLTDGQNPYAVIITCSDSRVSPNIVFNAGLGEIFEIAIAGNVIDTDALGSIEYGVEHANAPLIVVMGHEKCGAVTAEFNSIKDNIPIEGNIGALVSKINNSIAESSSIEEATHKNVQNSVNEIKSDPVIKELITEKGLKVIGAYYSLDGTVSFEE